MLGYGGGLVGGDSIDVTCSIDAGACGASVWTAADCQRVSAATDTWCSMLTHRIMCAVIAQLFCARRRRPRCFKATASADCVTQTFSFDLAAQATLALLPDPITCFERAKYRQKQVVRLEKGASLVLVDWLTSGRKRNFLSSGSINEKRTEIHEHWDFDEYDSQTDVYLDGTIVLSDRVRLCDDEPTALRKRMQGAHVLGVMVVLGPQMKRISDRLLELSQRKRLHHAKDITPQGRLASDTDFPGVLSSASALGDTGGVIARFIADDAETAMMYMRSILAPLEEGLGFKPFQENR
ncbi:hypothetical protein PINS_up002003 [Pythium insidiosum]|nr:hypothetical protein PINS_up002003 [Pythium insidiosum]